MMLFLQLFLFFMRRHDIIEDQQVRRYQEKLTDTTKMYIYLDCLCLFFNFLLKLVQ